MQSQLPHTERRNWEYKARPFSRTDMKVLPAQEEMNASQVKMADAHHEDSLSRESFSRKNFTRD